MSNLIRFPGPKRYQVTESVVMTVTPSIAPIRESFGPCGILTTSPVYSKTGFGRFLIRKLEVVK